MRNAYNPKQRETIAWKVGKQEGKIILNINMQKTMYHAVVTTNGHNSAPFVITIH